MTLSLSEGEEVDPFGGTCLSDVSLIAAGERSDEDEDASGGSWVVLGGLKWCCCLRKMLGGSSSADFFLVPVFVGVQHNAGGGDWFPFRLGFLSWL